MMTTNQLDVAILQLPDLGQTATFKISSPASVCFASNLLQNTLFFGLQSPAAMGQQASASIQMVLLGKEIVEQNAHAQPITSFEYANISGQEILFSGSHDGFVKAWDVTNSA